MRAFGGAALLAWESSCSENELVDSVADGVGLKQRQKAGHGSEEAYEPIETSEEFRLQGLVAIERSVEAPGSVPHVEGLVVRPISGKAKLLSSEMARETTPSSRAK